MVVSLMILIVSLQTPTAPTNIMGLCNHGSLTRILTRVSDMMLVVL